jgi:DNA mismatch repair protein MutL
METIQLLDSSVIDKIAAGEVLERPAQLVKELVENSLDAGALNVEVEISEGGRDLCVKDDGQGIPATDLEKALLRHATSKIKKVEDLFQIHSFGFRGEALSSAASVSHLTLTSRTSVEESGTRLEALFGQMGDKLEVSATQGAEVRVARLFDNVPARKKFLKSDASEVNQIKQVVKSFGLSRPDVAFRFSKDGELLFVWKQEDPLQRAREVLGLEDLYAAQGEENGIRVRAFYAAPNVTLRQNRGIWIFVQGRFVQDRSLSAAIMESYRNLLMHGEYPHCVLFLDLSPEEVDVNVHPTKSQVRFSRPSEVFRAVVHVLRSHLQTTPWLKEKQEFVFSSPQTFSASEEEKNQSDPKNQMTFLDRELAKTHLRQKEFVLRDSRPQNFEKEKFVFPRMEDLERAAALPEAFRWGNLQVLGQMAQTYILAQSDTDFYIVDQHAAHERVVFERLMAGWKEGKLLQQNYLLPLQLDLSEEDVENLMAHQGELEKMGVSIEASGPETLAVNAVPEVIKESGVAKALKLFAEQLKSQGGGFAVESVIADVFASMSCHSVVRAGQALSASEMKSLLEQMDAFPFSSFCPHGRPVFVKKSFSQIEREFGRIV